MAAIGSGRGSVAHEPATRTFDELAQLEVHPALGVDVDDPVEGIDVGAHLVALEDASGGDVGAHDVVGRRAGLLGDPERERAARRD